MGSRPSISTARTSVLLVLAAVVGPLVGALSPTSAFAQSPDSLTISGTVQGQLAPGVLQPLDLSLANWHPFALSVTGLVVKVDGITAPNADVGHPCTVDDFVVRQLAAPSPFTVNASTESRLSGLGFTEAQLPAVGMLDRPVNQDGCRGASVSLGYTAIIESTETAAAPAQPAVEPAPPSAVPTPSASDPAPPTVEPSPSAAESAQSSPVPTAGAVPSARPPTTRSVTAPSAAATATPTAAPPAAETPIKPGTQVSGRISGSADHRSRFAHLIDRIVETVKTVAPAVIRGARLPFGLLLAVLIFLLIQNWIDRRDPKLALAPSYADPDLPFDYRSPNPAKALS